MKLLIWGASGHGKVVLDAARACGRYKTIAFIDDFCPADRYYCGAEFLGTSANLESAQRLGFHQVLIAIGDNHARARCFDRAAEFGMEAAVVIHPAAVLSPSARIGSGTLVMPRCVVNADASVGENSILNTGAIIEHDCLLGKHVHISPNAALSGGVVVGDYSHVGIGALVIPGARIGSHCVIGAGAVVLGEVPDGTTAVGVPARVLPPKSRRPVEQTTV
jgi:acetyltransferase EpsM